MTPTRIVVVANKRWEAEPLVAVLLDRAARPPGLTDLHLESDWSTGEGPAAPQPCLRFLLVPPDGVDAGEAEVEIWCLQDLIDPTKDLKSTYWKSKVLPSTPGCLILPSTIFPRGQEFR